MRKQLKIELLNKDVILSERNTNDVFALSDFSTEGELTFVKALRISAILVNQSLELWFESFGFFKRFFLKREFSVRKLLKKLTPKEITELANQINEIEGVKKKTKAKRKVKE